MPATTTTSGDFSMQPSSVSTSSSANPLASAAAPSLNGQALQCIGAIARSFVATAIVAAILLVFVANASAQTWTPGSAYVAATLGGAPVYDSTPGSVFSVPTVDGGGGPSAMGIEAWVNLQAGTVDMIGEEVAFGIAQLSGFSDRMGLYTTWDGTNHVLKFTAAGTGGLVTVSSTATITPGVWTHVAGTYNGTDLFNYVNGVEAVNSTWNGDNGARFYNSNTLGSVASGVITGSIDGYLDGQVSGFRVWNTKITPTTTNSPVAFDVTGATGLLANYQIGTNGTTTPLVGSPVGAAMTASPATGSLLAYDKLASGTVAVTTDSYFLDTIDAGTLDLGNGGTTGALTTDAHIAALALEYRAEIHTADLDFGRFPGVRWKNPLPRR